MNDDLKSSPQLIDFVCGWEKFARWNKVRVNGVLTVSTGLTKRRAAEQRIFVEGVYDSTH